MSAKTVVILAMAVLAFVMIQSSEANLRGLKERLKHKMHKNGHFSSAYAQTVGHGHATANAGGPAYGHYGHHYGGLGEVGHEIAELGHEMKHELGYGHHGYGHHGYGHHGFGHHGFGHHGYEMGYGLGYGHHGHGHRHNRVGLGALLSNRGRRVAKRMGLFGHHRHGYHGHHGYYGHHSPAMELEELAVAATGGLGHHHHLGGYGPGYYGHSYHSYGPHGLGYGMHHLGNEMEYGLNRFGDDLAYAGARAHLGVRHHGHGVMDDLRHGMHEFGDDLSLHGMRARHNFENGFDDVMYGGHHHNALGHGFDRLKHLGKHLEHDIKDGLRHGKHELEYGVERLGLEADHGLNRLDNDIYRHGYYGGVHAEPYGHGYGRYSYGPGKSHEAVVAEGAEHEKKSVKQTSESVTEKEKGHETDDKYTRESNVDKHDNENMHVAYNKNKEDVQGSPNYYRSKKVGEQYVQDYNKNSRTNANDLTAKDRHTQAYDNTLNKSVDMVDSKTTKNKNGIVENVSDTSRRTYNDEDRRRYDSHPMGRI